MKIKYIPLLFIIILIGLACGCTQLDPYPEDAYFGDIYSNGVLIVPGGAAHDILSATHSDSTASAVARGDLITGQGIVPTWTALPIGVAGTYLQSDGTDVAWGALVETDPIYTGDPAFGITALDIAGWNALVGSQWTTDATGIHYDTGNVGINTDSTADDSLYVYSNAGGAQQTALTVAENSASAGAYGINLTVLGAKTGTTYGEYLFNAASSATNAINKYGLYIRSESNWTGLGAINYDLYLQEATGGTLNFEVGGDSSLRLATNGDTDDYFTFSTAVNIPTIAATGAAYLAIDNATLVNGNLSIGGSNNELRFYEGVNYVGFEAPALTGDQIWVLPDADGGVGDVLTTDGGGNLSWAAAGGGMANPMTTLGDIIYEDATPAPERLAGDITDARTFLMSQSVGNVAQAPVWATLAKADVGLGNVENTALSTWAGSANITTLGTIGSGTWNGGVIPANYGGTGVANNAASTITITGNFSLGLTLTNNTSVTLPTTGTLSTLAGTEELDNKTLDASVAKGTWTASGTWTLPALTLGGNTTFSENVSVVLVSALSNDGKYCGVTEAGTAGATLAFGDLVYFSSADNRWELTDASAEATTKGKIGIVVLAAANDGDPTVILLYGKVRADTAFPALTVGAPVFVSTDVGDVTVTAPSGSGDQVRVVGYGNTGDELFFNPDDTYLELS